MHSIGLRILLFSPVSALSGSGVFIRDLHVRDADQRGLFKLRKPGVTLFLLGRAVIQFGLLRPSPKADSGTVLRN